MSNKSTELVFILDESGSMYGLKKDTIGGFNSMVSKQKNIEGECYVTTVLFSDRNKTIHDRINLNEVSLMTDSDYEPNGCTALMDAVGDTINHITKIHKYIRKEDVPTKTLFVIMTDGEENASRRYSRKTIKDMIKIKKESGWEFIFIGANIEAEEVAELYGINATNAVNYHADTKGSGVVYESLNEVVGNFRVNKKLKSNWKDNIKKDYESRK